MSLFYCVNPKVALQLFSSSCSDDTVRNVSVGDIFFIEYEDSFVFVRVDHTTESSFSQEWNDKYMLAMGNTQTYYKTDHAREYYANVHRPHLRDLPCKRLEHALLINTIEKACARWRIRIHLFKLLEIRNDKKMKEGKEEEQKHYWHYDIIIQKMKNILQPQRQPLFIHKEYSETELVKILESQNTLIREQKFLKVPNYEPEQLLQTHLSPLSSCMED